MFQQHVLVFFPNYTYIFQQLQLQHHCMFLYKDGAKPLILYVGHFHPPLFFFIAVNNQYDACGLKAHRNTRYNFVTILQLLKYK